MIEDDRALPVVEVGRPTAGVRLGSTSVLIVIAASLIGLAMFSWPLWWPLVRQPGLPGGIAGTDNLSAPLAFAALLPVIVLLLLAQLSERGFTSRTLAMLGVLAALNALIRPLLGGGIGGVEAVLFLLILAGRVFGPGFGFLLGCVSLFASALLTGGIGPWLPFQMLVCAWIGLGAGLLPRKPSGRAELAMLTGYAVVSAYFFGLLMNLWFWPFLTSGAGSGLLDHDPDGSLVENLRRFFGFTVLTSLGWDSVRALTNAVLVIAVGPALLAILRRAARA